MIILALNLFVSTWCVVTFGPRYSAWCVVTFRPRYMYYFNGK